MFENNGSLNLWTTLYSTIYTHSFYTTPPPRVRLAKKKLNAVYLMVALLVTVNDLNFYKSPQ